MSHLWHKGQGLAKGAIDNFPVHLYFRLATVADVRQAPKHQQRHGQMQVSTCCLMTSYGSGGQVAQLQHALLKLSVCSSACMSVQIRPHDLSIRRLFAGVAQGFALHTRNRQIWPSVLISIHTCVHLSGQKVTKHQTTCTERQYCKDTCGLLVRCSWLHCCMPTSDLCFNLPTALQSVSGWWW